MFSFRTSSGQLCFPTHIMYSRVNHHKQLYLTHKVISFTRVQEEDVHWSAKLKVGHPPGAYFPLGGLHGRGQSMQSKLVTQLLV